MYLPPDRERLFRERKQSRDNPYRMLIYIVLIFTGLVMINGVRTGEIQPLSLTTPTPTRTSNSFQEEAEAYFMAGNLDAAISAYQDALAVDPENVNALVQLARIQALSSSLLPPHLATQRLSDALDNVNRAVELDDFNSDAHAVRAFVLDWNASYANAIEDRDAFLSEAAKAAIRATQLDSRNALAIAYRAEVLADQLNFTQARDLAELALSLEPNAMDTHRIFAYILEATGFYSRAIEEYQAAAALMPNYTYLYIKIGQNYRQLQLYDLALEYFDRAASINETLGIQDPLPYLAIAKTYTRQGEFFIAARNAETAVSYDPTNPDLYGELGIIRFRARNYEGSIPVLRCAVVGCSADQNEEQRVDVSGLPLSNVTVVYYYTYGSVLAALNQCDEAEDILNQVLAVYRNDEVISEIANEGLVVCATLRAGGSIPTATLTAPEDQMLDMTATPAP